jgi:hypothetical protein
MEEGNEIRLMGRCGGTAWGGGKAWFVSVGQTRIHCGDGTPPLVDSDRRERLTRRLRGRASPLRGWRD